MSAAEHLVELPPVSPGLVRLVEPDEPTLVAAEAAVEEHDHDRALELLARVRLSPGRTPALAVRLGDDRTLAEIYGQASNVAEHERQWLLARCYAEKARERFARLGDPAALGKVLNNLGGINFQLDETERAVECLEQAVALGL